MLIVFEGLDGAGKSTQVNLLKEYLHAKGIECEFMHFPCTDSPLFGELIARFLRGDLGNLETVNPYLIALIYAGDRHNAAETIRGWLNEGKAVILDRYVYSNIAFQCAKLESKEEREKLRSWIFDMEFGYFNIPKADVNLFLDVPLSFTEKKLTEQRSGPDRDYLMGKADIHEASISFQEKVREEYLDMCRLGMNIDLVSCANAEGTIDTPENIFGRITKEMERHGIA
ncbi:MAG TPA: dTMP kinase [Williamwhitmania sp.]|nr:dTMP kinase [Williamwhitmania sp.]